MDCLIYSLMSRATNTQFEDPDILERLDVRLLDVQPGDTGWDVFSLDYKVLPSKHVNNWSRCGEVVSHSDPSQLSSSQGMHDDSYIIFEMIGQVSFTFAAVNVILSS